MKVLVASKNPVKLEATRNAFAAVFKTDIALEGVSVPSGVSEQPRTDDETLRGAMNRTLNVAALNRADYYVGLEGGVEDTPDGVMAFAWIVVYNALGKAGKARTATFYLPDPVAELVRQGKELGEADDIVFGQRNSKQKMGAVGLLTGGVTDRSKTYQEAVVLALIPFIFKNSP